MTDAKTLGWAGDGSPEEIFQKALDAMGTDHPVNGALVVAWHSMNKDGSGTLRYLHTCSDGRNLTALLSDITFENHISKRSIFGNGNAKVDEVYPIPRVPKGS